MPIPSRINKKSIRDISASRSRKTVCATGPKVSLELIKRSKSYEKLMSLSKHRVQSVSVPKQELLSAHIQMPNKTRNVSNQKKVKSPLNVK
jgi:hypothetical protein